ncbi:MAG: DNA repair protein RadC [Bacteroidaceae bacterium]|nr:DNA repair protein RadC [Bacteroidaceae bacterium]
MDVHTGMGVEVQNPDGMYQDEESESVNIKRPSKKELDREEGRRGNERKLSKKVTYYDVPGAPDSTPRVAYRPTVARGSYRPTGVQGYVDPEKEKRIEKEKERRYERRQKKRAEERERRRHKRQEFFEHERKMSKLEASLHELYPTSNINIQKQPEEDPVPSIKKWTNDDLPMEKFQTDGVSQLSESELLAIIIGNGPKEFPTVDLMNQMLDDCGNDLSKLGKKTMEELMCYRGIGKNRAIAIVAACEFGKRFRKTAPEEKPVLKNALAIGDYMMPQLEDLDVEEFWALFFNPKHELLRRVRICRGEVSENAADPRNIMRFGVLYNATYIVTVHNHVSGNPSPTKFDSTIAAKLTQAAESVRMTLRDHIILADEQYYSFKDNKKL